MMMMTTTTTTNTPGLPAHSISNESTRSGAMPIHSPSGLWLTISAKYTSISSCECEVHATAWPLLDVHGRRRHLPALAVTHEHPTISRSTMYRMTYAQFDSNVSNWWCTPLGIVMPPSSSRRVAETTEGSAATIRRKTPNWLKL